MNDDIQSLSSSQHHTHPEENTCKRSFTPGHESVSKVLITTISHINEQDAVDLPPLQNVIDTEAMDRLFAPRSDGTMRHNDLTISFCYVGYEVLVDSDGTLTLIEQGESSGA